MSRKDRFEFDILPDGLRSRSSTRTARILPDLSSSSTLKEIAQRLAAGDDGDMAFTWIDIFIFASLGVSTEAEQTWSADDIWSRLLDPLARWVG